MLRSESHVRACERSEDRVCVCVCVCVRVYIYIHLPTSGKLRLFLVVSLLLRMRIRSYVSAASISLASFVTRCVTFSIVISQRQFPLRPFEVLRVIEEDIIIKV